MKKGILSLLILGLMAMAAAAAPVSLRTAKVTQTHNEVQLQEKGTGGNTGQDLDPSPTRSSEIKIRPAAVGDIVKGGRVLSTGRKSRAELLFNDSTVTRLGANSIFSFRPDSRNVHLSSGFLLIHTPKGKGGATVTTPTATAAVLGTTIMLSVLPDGSVKMVCLEGTGTLAFGGQTETLAAGQLCIYTPGQGISSPATIDLAQLTKTSIMLSSFSNPLGSEALIQDAIQSQAQLVASGKLKITGDDQGLKFLGDSAVDSAIQQQTIKPTAPSSPPPSSGPPAGGPD